jgi:2-polyprenyl-3-methyl-5-hydroxy-6-metoxy-1,4-benzoquinol methylase
MAAIADFPCRLCGEAGLRLYYTLGSDGRFKYYKCPTCTLVNYDLATGLDQTQYDVTHVDPLDDSLPFNRARDQSFHALMRDVRPPGRLLDIGSGNGRLLYLARQAGWQVKGLELSAGMAAFVRQELDIAVEVGNFLEMTPSLEDASSFDVVVLRHVLEHLPDPLLTMEKISVLMKPDGYLLLEMPNIEAMTKKWSRFVVGAGLHKRSFDADFRAGHCNEYSRKSMRCLAEKTGFRVVRWETYSRKLLPNWFYNRVPIGNKARALLRRSGA